jgi:hypothetical protein
MRDRRLTATTLHDGKILHVLKHCHHLFPAHRGKSLKEVIEGVATFQVIEQALYWNGVPAKTNSPPSTSGSREVALICGQSKPKGLALQK